MADRLTRSARSRLMSRVRTRDTAPERIVRSVLHRLGYRFRLNGEDLPGKPDIVLPRHRKVIFVHGCFWHGHSRCKRGARPTTNVEFWNKKLDSNISRDRRARIGLKKLGWQSLIVWECQTKNLANLRRKLERFMSD